MSTGKILISLVLIAAVFLALVYREEIKAIIEPQIKIIMERIEKL